ncbi:MAG: hypothetical protein HOP31_10440 [Ignavibacteria bacterium]|nr:hypothetical protein [Ignavibacteria bacterium]
MYKKLVWILALILLVLVADRVIFTSTDVKVNFKPEVLRASVNSEIVIDVERVNLLGFKVPFSKVDVQFVIEDGRNLVELTDGEYSGSVKVRSKGVEGEAVIGIYSLKSGVQIRKITIVILPRDVAVN